MTTSKASSYCWKRVLGGLSGAMSIGTGAYGAHGLKSDDKISATYKSVFETGSRDQLVHSALLVATPAILPCTKSANIAGAFFAAGMAMFSGSCYAVGLTQDRSNGKLAPVGGFALIGGWLSLALFKR